VDSSTLTFRVAEKAARPGLLARWLTHMRQERQVRRATADLMALDDRLLADIGLCRDQITYAVRHGRR
jgi:uncharacterized protein YjiS (DUF1127 family)